MDGDYERKGFDFNSSAKIVEDEYFMRCALRVANIGARKGEVPVGAVIVSNNVIVSRAHNKMVSSANRTLHAEMIAISRACSKLKTGFLTECTIYVTLEPCAMCAKAISLSRIERLCYAAVDKKGGAVESGVQIFTSYTTNHIPKIISGILAEESSLVIRKFFQDLRKGREIS